MSVLITGATGFIGRYLVQHLSEDGAELALLVRPQSLDKAQRIIALLRSRSQITLLEGDVTRPRFGLSRTTFDRLRGEATQVFHLAADYSPRARSQSLRGSIIDGTENLLQLAQDLPRLDRLCYVSTAHVCGAARGKIREDELITPPRFHSLYEACKHAAETLVRQVSNLPVTIFRPSMVIGHSGNGAIKKSGGPYRLIRALDGGWLRFYPGPCTAPLHLVPVDFVVAAMLAISRKTASRGKTFHLVDPDPQPARFFIKETARLLGKPAPSLIIPLNLLHSLPITLLRRGVAILNQEVQFETTNTLAALAGTGIYSPPLESYLAKIIQTYREEK